MIETTHCPSCNSLMRKRGTVLRVENHADPVWQAVLRCTVCGAETRRPLNQVEYAEVLAQKARNRARKGE